MLKMHIRRLNKVLLASTCALAAVLGYLGYTAKAHQPLVAKQVITNVVVAVRAGGATNITFQPGGIPGWAALESTNYYVYIQNLRAFGCPEETIRDMVAMDIAKLYAEKRAEARRNGKPYRFWVEEPKGDIEVERKVVELEKEEHNLIRTLLGTELHAIRAKYWENEYQQPQLDFLPDSKRAQVVEWNTKYDALENAIYLRAKNGLSEEDIQHIAQIQDQREKELAGILTPEEIEAYEMRHSATAESLRAQLMGFQPTEEEFQKLFRIQKEFEKMIPKGAVKEYSEPEIATGAQEKAQQAYYTAVREVLGDTRFAEFQRAHDPDYQALVQVAQRFQLPEDVSMNVYDLKMQAEQQKMVVDSNPNLSSEQRRAALDAIEQETERAVSSAMGPKIYHAYSQAAGDWIRGLARPNLQVMLDRRAQPQ